MEFSKEVIKRIRLELLMSQTEFAKQLGVSFATVNRWENGHHAPTITDKRKIRDLCLKKRIKFE